MTGGTPTDETQAADDLVGVSREQLLAEVQRLRLEQRHDRVVYESIVNDLQVHQGELELQHRELLAAQSALEGAKARYEELYDFAPVAYLTFDRHGVIQEVNLTGTTMIGGERTRLIGQPFAALVKMRDPRAFLSHLLRCERERRPVVTELRFVVGGESERDIHAVTVPVLDRADVAVAFRTSFTDISQLKRTEAALEQARHEAERLRDRFESLDRATLDFSHVLARVDGTQGGLVEVLQHIVEHARGIVGAEYAAIGLNGDPDHPFDPWVQAGVEPAVASVIGRTPRSRGLLAEVIHARHALRLRDLREHRSFQGFPDHHPEMRSFLGVPVLFGDEVLGHLYLTNKRGADEFTDDDQTIIDLFAARAGVAIRIAALARHVHEAVRAREDVLAVVSHDLRGPLSNIALSAEMMKRVASDGAGLLRPIEVILRSAATMTQLIEDLLQAATIDAGTFTIVANPCDLSRCLETTLAMFDTRAAERSIHLERDVPADLPLVRCDERRIAQVLSNLVENALKFVTAGGHVRVRAGVTGAAVWIAVADDGAGIAPDQLPHLFDRYWKGAGEARRGTGLGLHIAKGIVEAHGGRISADSSGVGRGSTFTFTLPLSTDHPDPRHASGA